jgi:hypothetical protein
MMGWKDKLLGGGKKALALSARGARAIDGGLKQYDSWARKNQERQIARLERNARLLELQARKAAAEGQLKRGRKDPFGVPL